MCDPDWPFYYRTPSGATIIPPTRRLPSKGKTRSPAKPSQAAIMKSAASGKTTGSNGKKDSRQSSFKQTPTKTRRRAIMPSSPAKSRSGSKPRVSARGRKSVTTKSVVLNMVREPSGKGGYRFDNSHARDEKLDTTTAYVSQKDMKSKTPFTLDLVAEPKGKGGVRFANEAKEKLDVTTIYLSQADRKTLGVKDTLTVKVNKDSVAVTP